MKDKPQKKAKEPNNVRKILVVAKEILSNEDRWTKGAMALSKTNRPVKVSSPAACKFCVLGALERASFIALNISLRGSVSMYDVACKDHYEALNTLEKLITKETAGAFDNISEWNDADERTHTQVVNMFKKVIKATA